MYNSGGKTIYSIIAAILIFLFIKPYFLWNLHNTTSLFFFLGVFLFLVFFPNVDIKSKKREGLFILFAILLLLYSFYNNLNVFGFICNLCYIIIPFSKKQFAINTYNYFLTIYSIIIGVSSIVWILSLIGVVHPIGVISPLNELKGFNYSVYPMLVQANVLVDLHRFSGPFDEPGVIGTISTLVLTIGKFNVRDKRLMIVFITGFLTMSFFYTFSVLVYYIVYIFTISKDKKLGFFLLFILSLLVEASLNNELLYDRLWSRFIWDTDSGSFAGDNRLTDNSRILLEKIAGTSAFYFGIGKTDAFIKATEGEFSLFNTIIQYGVIYVLFYIYFFAAYGWKYKINFIVYSLFFFVLLACLYQRPALFQPEYLFLFSLMAMSCGNLLENEETGKQSLYEFKQIN